MRYITIILGFLAVVLVGIYTLAFTSFGNSILAPMIESKIKEETTLDAKLTTFKLDMSAFEIVLEMSSQNIVSLDGTYSLFSRSFDLAYSAKFTQLSDLQNFVKRPLQGELFAQGTLKGDMDLMQIEGMSDVAKSETTYNVILKDKEISFMSAHVEKADLSTLLEMLGEKPYLSGALDLDIDFKNTNAHALDGVIRLKTQNAKLDSKLMQSDFNVTIPQTALSLQMDAELKGDDVEYNATLNSNLAKITSSGKIIPETLMMDIKYLVDVGELAVLKPITKADIRGPLAFSGTLKGDRAKLQVQGISDVAGSDTKFSFLLEDFALRSLQADVQNLKLSKLFSMLEMPHYADGTLFLKADINDAREDKQKGTVQTNIKNGVLDSKTLSKLYAFQSPMPKTTFEINATSVLDKNSTLSQVQVDSSLAALMMKNLRFDRSDASLDTDYEMRIAKLESLYFLTQRHIRGGLVADGRVKSAKNFDATFNSDIMNGKITATLHNDDLRAEFKSLQTKSILHTLIYPEIFDASISGTFDYNLLEEKGNFTATLADGYFTQNEIFTLIKQYGILDMYQEKFKGEIKADIHKEFIVASLELLSEKSSVKTKDAKLNSKTKELDADLDLEVNKNPISAKIKGTTDAPKVSIDLEKFIKSKSGDAIKNEVSKFLNGLFK